MNTTPKHTPTPWLVVSDREVHEKETDHVVAVCDWDLEEQNNANAAFIVRAVNAYERDQEDRKILLLACKSALRIFQAWEKDAAPIPEYATKENPEWSAARISVEMMEAAIRKAEEGR